MTQNLEIRWKPHAIEEANKRGVCSLSVKKIIENPSYIEPGNKNLREVFIGMALVEGKPYPIGIPVSAGVSSSEAWLAIETVIPKREYKNKFVNSLKQQ